MGSGDPTSGERRGLAPPHGPGRPPPRRVAISRVARRRGMAAGVAVDRHAPCGLAFASSRPMGLLLNERAFAIFVAIVGRRLSLVAAAGLARAALERARAALARMVGHRASARRQAGAAPHCLSRRVAGAVLL